MSISLLFLNSSINLTRMYPSVAVRKVIGLAGFLEYCWKRL